MTMSGLYTWHLGKEKFRGNSSTVDFWETRFSDAVVYKASEVAVTIMGLLTSIHILSFISIHSSPPNSSFFSHQSIAQAILPQSLYTSQS